MNMRKILTDNTQRELTAHGTDTFPMTVSHDDLWSFEGKHIPIHWHNDLEISLPREGTAVYQVYQKTYIVHPGEGILFNSNVPHSCQSLDNQPVRYSTILFRPDFLYGSFGSDVERLCLRPFLQNAALPCIHLAGAKPGILQTLDHIEQLFDTRPFCFQLQIQGLLCESIASILTAHQKELQNFTPHNQLDLQRLEQILSYLHTHAASVFSLQQLTDEIHLSRESCCRLFRKMTGKTITSYLEEYRTIQSLSLVQSGLYSMTQIADMTGFSNASRFAAAFRRHYGCKPSEYLTCIQTKNKGV